MLIYKLLLFIFWYISLTLGILISAAVGAVVVAKPIFGIWPSLSLILLSQSVF